MDLLVLIGCRCHYSLTEGSVWKMQCVLGLVKAELCEPGEGLLQSRWNFGARLACVA